MSQWVLRAGEVTTVPARLPGQPGASCILRPSLLFLKDCSWLCPTMTHFSSVLLETFHLGGDRRIRTVDIGM